VCIQSDKGSDSCHPLFSYKSESKTLKKLEKLEIPNNGFVFYEHFDQYNVLHRLNIFLLGSSNPPSLEEYELCVRQVEFSGHLSYVKPAFSMVANLKSCTSVRFYLGSESQLPLFREIVEDEEKTLEFDHDLPILEKVVDLRVIVLNATNSSEAIRKIVEQQYMLVFKYSRICFPNLKTLQVDIPASGSNYEFVSAFLRQFPTLEARYQTQINGTRVRLSSLQKTTVAPPYSSPSLFSNASSQNSKDSGSLKKVCHRSQPIVVSEKSPLGSRMDHRSLANIPIPEELLPDLKMESVETESVHSEGSFVPLPPCGILKKSSKYGRPPSPTSSSASTLEDCEYSVDWPSDPRKVSF